MKNNNRESIRLRDQLIRSFLGIGALRALSMPISLIASIILARSLGPDQFGQYTFVMALIPLLALPAAGGLPKLLTREVAKSVHAGTWNEYQGILRFSHHWALVYSLLLVSVTWLAFALTGFSDLDGKWDLLPIAVLLVPIVSLIGINRGTTKGLGHVAVSEIPAMFIRPATFLAVITVLAAAGGLTPTSAVAVMVGAAALAYVVGAFMLKSRQPSVLNGVAVTIRRKKWSAALVPFTMIALIITLNSKIAILLLGLLDSDASVAIFQVASTGAGLVSVSLVLVNMVIGPQIVKFWAGQDTENLQLLSRHSARGAIAIAAPTTLVFLVFGEEILDLLYGVEYAASAFWPLVILSAGQFFSVFVGSVGLLLTMSGNEMDTLRSQSVALVVNVGACAVLIPIYGTVGAAIGATIGLVTWNVLLAIQVKRRLGIRPTAL